MNQWLQLIVGLGNPGDRYRGTRHNAGEDFVEALARRLSAPPLTPNSTCSGRTVEVFLKSRKVRLLIPEVFMNCSGQSVAALANFYRIAPENILVAHDELDLAPGTARFKFGGGHGGHNGLRDTIRSLGNIRDFYRLRIGIGHPGSADLVTDHVLSKPSPNDRLMIENSIDRAVALIPIVAQGDWAQAMKELHTSPGPSPEI